MSLAGSMLRTLKRQVIPDTTLWRRLQAAFFTGKPPKISGGTIVRPRSAGTLLGKRSVLRDIDITYVFDDHPKRGKGYLRFSEPIWTETVDGNLSGGKKGMTSYALFSATGKMSAPSFSIPAGPPQEGGTCAAANQGARNLVRPSRGTAPGGSRKDSSGNTFICDLCYATAGNYFYPNVSVAQAARMIWCERLLEEDPSGVTLGRELAKALENTAVRAHYGNLSKRLGHELGIWKNGALWAPGLVTGRRGVTPIQIPATGLPAWTGFSSSNDFFAGQGVPEGSVCGFFRIHDSGDLNIGAKLETWKGYLRAWEFVAKTFPSVWFWMPVRTWVNKPMIPELQRVNQLHNMEIRASPLFVNEAPPEIPGLSTSGVHTGILNADPHPSWAMNPRSESESRGLLGLNNNYACPVRPRDKSSCAEQGCRVCWIVPGLNPSYSEH